MHRDHHRRHHSPRERQLRDCARRLAKARRALDSAPAPGILEFAERTVDFEDAWDRLLETLAA